MSVTYKCEKCGHGQATLALRRIKVAVGWAMTALECVAPAHMCQRCGHLGCNITFTIGDLVEVPSPQTVGVQSEPKALPVDVAASQ